MSDGLPSLPEIDPGLLATHGAAHQRLHEARADVRPALDLLFRRFAFDLTVMSVASIPPSLRRPGPPPLLPAPRAFLAPRDHARVDGVRAGLLYVDARLAMQRLGHGTEALLNESAQVLNALTEGRTDNPRMTNPGMFRATPVWPRSDSTFQFPDAEFVERLTVQAMRVAGSAAAPPCVRAAWLMLTLMLIHPFMDGNGRVGRLLYLLVTGEAMADVIDWGVAEHLLWWRDGLLHQPAQAQTLDSGVDLLPLVSLVTRASVDGARLMHARLGLLRTLDVALVGSGLSPAEALALVALTLRRRCTADELAGDLQVDRSGAIDLMQGLVAGRWILRAAIPPSRARQSARGPSYVLGRRGADEVRGALAGAADTVRALGSAAG